MTTESRTEPTSAPHPRTAGKFRDLTVRASGHRVMVTLLVAFATWCLVMQIALFRSLMPPIGLIQALLFGLAAVAVAWWGRVGLVGATTVCGIALLVNMPAVLHDLAHPQAVGEFVWTLVALAMLITAIITGIATLRHREADI